MKVEDLPVAVVEIDRDRRIVSANDALADLVQLPCHQLLGRTIGEALRPRAVSGENLLDKSWHSSAALRSVHRITEQEILVRRSNGQEVEALVEGAYERDGAGGLQGATLILRPRTRGPRRPSSGVAIVSAVSHELRSPLTSVRGYTALLMKRWDDIADEDRRSMLTQIDHDARRISRMIGELLDISRLETGRLQLNRVDLDVAALAKDVLAKVEIAYPDLDAILDFPPEFGRVDADPDKVEQVLINLVENACKYGSPKGIRIVGIPGEDFSTIEVSDCGKGVPEADLPHLFKQFFHSREGRPTGTGLGLWISRGLIEAHGGEMTATSRSDPTVGPTGTTFRFTLPGQSRLENLRPPATDRIKETANST